MFAPCNMSVKDTVCLHRVICLLRTLCLNYVIWLSRTQLFALCNVSDVRVTQNTPCLLQRVYFSQLQ
jgi:hypothetical protein